MDKALPHCLFITIPVHNERDVLLSLNSLYQAHLPPCKVQVLLIVNARISDPLDIHEQNELTYREVNQWIALHSNNEMEFEAILDNSFSDKDGGVGLARKIIMDKAMQRSLDINQPRNIIVGFDADCTCAPNYLVEIYNYFSTNLDATACSIHFEHPLQGSAYDPDIYTAIQHYELHLRYYKNSLEFTNYPYAYHTVGSAMAVTAESYRKQGGMNKRKAGEDFYFLQKMMMLGGYGSLVSTCVYPSPRSSNRVPFGTGKAVNDWLNLSDAQNEKVFESYHPTTFNEIKQFIAIVPQLYKLESIEQASFPISEMIMNYLKEHHFNDRLREIQQNSNSLETFIKRFYQWLTPFRVLKLVHWSRDNYYPNMELLKASRLLLSKVAPKLENPRLNTATDFLLMYRMLDKNDPG